MKRETESGLSAAEAAARLAEDGPNALPGGQRRGWFAIIRETAREPMFLLLFAAGTLYLVFGELQEGLILFGFVLVTLGLTLYQEGRTERAIEALRDLTSPRALVIRDGQPLRITGREVVRGDWVMLAEGDRVPADGVLITGSGLQVDESLLTGEAVPVSKTVTTQAPAPARPGGNDTPFVYYLPWLADIFQFAPLPFHALAAAFGLGLVSVAVFQLLKFHRPEKAS